MTCKVCQRLIFELVDGDLPASKEAQVLAHVRACPACGAFLDEERERMRALPAALERAALSGKLPATAVERLGRHLQPAAKKRPGAQAKRPLS